MWPNVIPRLAKDLGMEFQGKGFAATQLNISGVGTSFTARWVDNLLANFRTLKIN